ncbi:MAG: hypothetical protein WAR57_05970 [Candidatus Phosphoribacter sp.]|nr:hypothetical protein [Actinomycetales bacterium]
MSELVFPDSLGYADLATLVRRGRGADPDGAVRLQVLGSTLAVWVAVLPGTGLFAEGSALGVRGLHLAQPAELDVVVTSAALADRFARDGDGATRLAVPPANVRASWSGALPALSGWSSDGELAAAELVEVARAGIAEIGEAAAVGASAGSLAVQALRTTVWARAIPTTGSAPVPAGAAFAAYVLGFVRPNDASVRVSRSGWWVRLTTRGGDVIAR